LEGQEEARLLWKHEGQKGHREVKERREISSEIYIYIYIIYVCMYIYYIGNNIKKRQRW
jgi:hypothetical protein